MFISYFKDTRTVELCSIKQIKNQFNSQSTLVHGSVSVPSQAFKILYESPSFKIIATPAVRHREILF